MQTITERPARGAGEVSRKTATRQRKNEARTSEPLKANASDIGIPIADYKPTDIIPEQFFRVSRKQREALIEALIESLDAETGDADFEDTGDDELSLGFLECFTGSGRIGNVFCTDDREVECEDEGAQCDDEGDQSDSGVADTDGLLEQCAGHHHCGYGTSGFARAAI